MPSDADPNSTDYTIRRLTPADADGVVVCVRAIYGDSYVHKDLYNPAAIVRQNETGDIVSVVALVATGVFDQRPVEPRFVVGGARQE